MQKGISPDWTAVHFLSAFSQTGSNFESMFSIWIIFWTFSFSLVLFLALLWHMLLFWFVLSDSTLPSTKFQLVFSSSATVYGWPKTVPCTEESPICAANPYGRTKVPSSYSYVFITVKLDTLDISFLLIMCFFCSEPSANCISLGCNLFW